MPSAWTWLGHTLGKRLPVREIASNYGEFSTVLPAARNGKRPISGRHLCLAISPTDGQLIAETGSR